MIPTEIAIEDLSGLDKQMPNLILNLVFCGADKDVDKKLASHRRLFVRLVDKAIDEYCSARTMIVAQVEEGKRSAEEMTMSGRGIYIFKFIDHMENCISTTRKVLRYLDFMKGNQDGLQIPRIVRKQIELLSSSVIAVRNHVEHMDERIQDGKIAEDEPVMMKIIESQDGVVLCGDELKFSELSSLLKKLHGLNTLFAAWNVEQENA